MPRKLNARSIPWDEPGKNARRAAWAEKTVEFFQRLVMPGEDDVYTVMKDLVADLCHMADLNGIDPDDLLHAGRASHAQDYTTGEPGSDARLTCGEEADTDAATSTPALWR